MPRLAGNQPLSCILQEALADFIQRGLLPNPMSHKEWQRQQRRQAELEASCLAPCYLKSMAAQHDSLLSVLCVLWQQQQQEVGDAALWQAALQLQEEVQQALPAWVADDRPILQLKLKPKQQQLRHRAVTSNPGCLLAAGAEALSSCSQQTDCFQIRPCWVVQSEGPAGTGSACTAQGFPAATARQGQDDLHLRFGWGRQLGQQADALAAPDRDLGQGPCQGSRSCRFSTAAAANCRRVVTRASGY